MNELQLFFENNSANRIHKWMHYFEIYDRYFSRFRGTDVHLLEFGVSHGGSLRMWKSYFGPKARIYGVDNNPLCKSFDDGQTTVIIGDQGDRSFLESLKRIAPRVDILIDDGGHTMKQQVATFEVLYGHVAPTGVYLCEDLMTSYWAEYGGGAGKRGTFVEYAKSFVDSLNAWHSQQSWRLRVSPFTTSTLAIHFYDGVLVLEKRPVGKPFTRMTGVATLQAEYPLERRLWTRTLAKARQLRSKFDLV